MYRQLILIFGLVSLNLVISGPIGGLIGNLDELEDENYDIVIDQKQNGTQNFRIRVNGLSIALPEEDEHQSPSQAMDIASLLGLQLTSTGPTISGNDYSDLAALFDWKKKSNELIKAGDAHGRTKDLPTGDQIAGDTKHALKDYAKNANKRYKLLVGEKYIIPLIQLLKRGSEHFEED